MKNLIKNFLLILLIFLMVSFIFNFFFQPPEKEKRVTLGQLVEEINQGKVKRISVIGNEIQIIYKDETQAKSRKETEIAFSQTLINYGLEKEKLRELEVEIKEVGGTWVWLAPVLFAFLPLLLLILFFWFILRQAKGGAMQAFDFTKARARLFGAGGQPREKITFKDVAGLKEAKEELMEVVDFLKTPKKYLQMGAKIPRGVMLVGAPGTGKTMLAKAIASESNVPFFSISGSEFIELFVGVGASVSGDTPILIKTSEGINLLPIKEFVDQYYKESESGFIRPVNNVQSLGFQPLATKFYGAKSDKKKFFGGSRWTNIQSVLRHKVNEIYGIYYRGGLIKTTGDHSIFVRSGNMIAVKKASELKPGDILVNLPFKVRSEFIPGLGTTHKIRAHQFPEAVNLELDLFDNRLAEEQWKYNFALEHQSVLSRAVIGKEIGVSQVTVKNWQLGYHQPRFFSANVFSNNTLSRIKVTPKLMRLFGYYTAEGRITEYYTQFVFGLHEKELHNDCVQLLKEIFCLEPTIKEIPETNSLRITLSSPIVADFFQKHCGNGSHLKHLPSFIWELPREHFLSFLDGYNKGDGYTTKDGKIVITSVSQQLIRELAWICSMHGLQVGVGQTFSSAGRIIHKNPLPETKAWRLIIGKTSHPFREKSKFPYQWKKPIITKIIKKSYNDYVYDLCGCDNEAFFGGEKPILLHNSRVRNLFDQARKTGKAIIFIDEIDSIGKVRGTGITGGHEEREQTLNQILAEMDGIGREEGLIVMGATNAPHYLDPALLRPGRFDRRIILDLPDINDREEILKIHCRGKPLALNVNLREVAERTPGFSGADLANVVNEAAIMAARRNKHQVFQEEFLESIEKVLLGPERKSHILSKKEKEIAAFHEAGHALVASSLPETEQIRKISIVARGMAAGYVLKMPTNEKKIKTKTEFLVEIATLLGGYCAEKIKFDEITTGAANDLEIASKLARKLVKEYGMSSLGPISFGEREELVFLGRELSEQRNYSEKVATQIDNEVEKFINDGRKKATEILTKKRNLLEKIARILIEKETIEKEEFEKLIGIKKSEIVKPLSKRRKSVGVKIKRV